MKLATALLLTTVASIVNGQWILEQEEDDYDAYEDIDENEEVTWETDEEDENKGEKPCSPPPSIRNGRVDIWGEGLLLEYSCDDKFYAVGSTHGACDLSEGQWTIEPPLCVEEGCPALPAPKNGVVSVDESGGVATFTCRLGYHLVGSNMLLCEGGRWTGIYPICAVSPKPTESPLANTTDTKDKSKPVLKESVRIEDSDETCFHSHVEPPSVENAVMETSYVMNEIRGRYITIATYTCFHGYKLKDPEANQMYCRNLKWGAPEVPECVPENEPCLINNGGCQHVCVPGDGGYACACDPGYTLGQTGKDCIDVDECAIDNGGCHQECHNTLASFFCSCFSGYVAKGHDCVGK
ncbi:hypothetical protein C0Q70_05601 [Pomacea canaliculata]|uniref:Sushi domain-containing protein n=1 Tax=Pomacea canaliculata TaxID=400727 RepID=A0A2T7PLP1_POMCA|nr:hypothetical protein C0Q70_05601 [Pomacea canaliculata]